MNANQKNVCAVCATSAKSRCSNCNVVYYCSTEHQKQDWKSHKTQCYPFEIATDNKLGRYLKSTRDIRPYEVILKEKYLVRGPSQNTAPVCLGCLNEIDENDHIDCEACGWPMCSRECKLQQQHVDEHKGECNLLHSSGNKVSINYFNGEPHPMYQSITPLRALLLKDSKLWQQLCELESHENVRRGSAQWKNDVETIAKAVPRIFKTSKYSEDEIMNVTGILQINGHEVPTSDPPHVAVYHKCSFLEHSCRPNLTKSFTKTGSVTLWSTELIKKGSNLSICYSDALWGTQARQSHLQFTKLFKCQCTRCKDVTEFGTYYSALVCTKANCNGPVLPVNSETWDDKWKCLKCNDIMEKRRIETIMDRAGQDLRAMPKADVNACIKYLNHYGKFLYKNHFFLVEVKIQLVQFIGAGPTDGTTTANSLQIVDLPLLDRKINLAREIISLIEKLAPNEARILGLMCFELHSGLSEKARRLPLEARDASVELLRESYEFVERTINYLQYEPAVLSEGFILKQAKVNREFLQEFMGFK